MDSRRLCCPGRAASLRGPPGAPVWLPRGRGRRAGGAWGESKRWKQSYVSFGMPIHVLALAAHRDDVELTCASLLLKAVDQGYSTAILDLTARESGTRGSAE